MTTVGANEHRPHRSGQIGRLHGALVASQPGVDEVLVADVDPGGRPTRHRRSADGSRRRSSGRWTTPTPRSSPPRPRRMGGSSWPPSNAACRPSARSRSRSTWTKQSSVVDQVEATGAVVQVGFQRRFDPAYREARRLIASGELGTVYLVRLIAHDHEPPPEAYIPLSGGLFRDSSIHDIDAFRWITGQEVDEVYATGSVRGFPIFERYLTSTPGRSS